LVLRCEKLKETLTLAESDELQLDELIDQSGSKLTVTREEFEHECCRPLIQRAIDLVKKVLQTTSSAHGLPAVLSPADIHKVLLVGGTSRIPLVRRMLVEEAGFDRPGQVDSSLECDTAVARGAAVYAAQLCGKAIIDEASLDCATALPIGTYFSGDRFCEIIPRFALIPSKCTKKLSTTKNDQFSFQFKIYEGVRMVASANRLLGSWTVNGLPSGAAGDVFVSLTLELDRNGILHASAEHENGRQQMPPIDYSEQRATGSAVQRMLDEAKEHESADKEQCERKQAMSLLKMVVQKAKYKCVNRSILDLCSEVDGWIESNKQPTPALVRGKHDEFILALEKISKS